MLKFNLVENALDSLEHAITTLTSKKNLETGDYIWPRAAGLSRTVNFLFCIC